MKTAVFLALTSSIKAGETLIFDEEFKTFNHTLWQHEITMSGGGNWEFEYYTNNRTNSFVKEGVMHLQPTLTVDTVGENTLRTGDLNLWGSAPGDQCTGNNFYGCERNAAASGNVLNPVQSARLRTVEAFKFKYGRMEIKAQLPKGDWLWPAIWMLPAQNQYGQWPASGEIDIVETRGNDASCAAGGRNKFASTLHWGPGYPQDAYMKAHAEYEHPTDLTDDFHLFGLEWTEEHIRTTIDGKTVLEFVHDDDMFTKGDFPEVYNNPWQYDGKNAPFDQEFFLIFNVAAGGTNGYFPDGECGKTWADTDPHAPNAFYDSKDKWYSTWNYPASNDAAMKIDYVKVWQNDGKADKEEEVFVQN